MNKIASLKRDCSARWPYVIYFLMLELFVDKIHFFKFLSISDKPLGPSKNYHCYSYIVQVSVNFSIQTRKGKYPVLISNTKFHRLIKHAKISCSIAPIVFCKFSCVTYQYGLNRGTSRMRHSRYLKKYEPC